MGMRFGNWNIRSMYRAYSLRVVAAEISKCKLELVGVKEVRRDRVGTETTGQYTSYYGQGNHTLELGTGFFAHKRTISAVKRVEFVSDRMSYIIRVLRDRWCDNIVLNVHAPTEEKSYGVKDRFYEQAEQVFDKFLNYNFAKRF
jgi:hypothetical protein